MLSANSSRSAYTISPVCCAILCCANVLTLRPLVCLFNGVDVVKQMVNTSFLLFALQSAIYSHKDQSRQFQLYILQPLSEILIPELVDLRAMPPHAPAMLSGSLSYFTFM